MTIQEMVREVVATKSACMFRYRKDSVLTGVAQYDTKPLFTGSKNGWMLLDATTANRVNSVFDGIKPEQAAKLNNLPIGKVLSICWGA